MSYCTIFQTINKKTDKTQIIEDSDESNEEVFDPARYAYPGQTSEDIVQIKEVFDSYDLKSSGYLGPMDIRAALLKYFPIF